MDILRTATLLHDTARADQNQTGHDHAAEGARRARIILTEMTQFFEQMAGEIRGEQ